MSVDSSSNLFAETNAEVKMEVRNEKALAVYSRVQKKLTGAVFPSFDSLVDLLFLGRDFDPEEELSVNDQVEKLILQATAVENLCQCFLGTLIQCNYSTLS